MVHEKAFWIQILGIFLFVVSLWLCIGVKVNAEGEDDFMFTEISNFTYNGVEYPYFYIGSFDYKQGNYYYRRVFDTPVYGIRTGSKFLFVCDVANVGRGVRVSDNAELATWDFYEYAPGVYVYNCTMGNLYDCSFPDSGVDDEGLRAAFYQYFASDNFVGYSVAPVWRTADAEPSIKLRNFHAEIVNDCVVASWAGVNREILKPSLRGIDNFENTYVRVTFALCSSDETLEPIVINYPDGVLGSTPFKISDNGFIVELSELEIPDTYRLWYVQATPYWYENDDPAGDLKIGSYSQVYFGEDGEYLYTDTKAPHVSYDPEEPEKSIWDSITDFTSDIGDQITGALAAAFIPDSEELLELVGEMNAWFSDRFGFIWYPFDLAVEIVAALITGEANSMFTVPALELNMFGGITLWEEFQTDLDTFGILKYVRYFTSMVLSISTVRLALSKFDEWIGGKKS